MDCSKLFGDLIGHLEPQERTGIGSPTVSMMHTTNYQAQGQRWAGWALIDLILASPSGPQMGLGQSPGIDLNGRPLRMRNLVGRGQRLLSSKLKYAGKGGLVQPITDTDFGPAKPTQPFDATQPEGISYEITPSGLLMLSGQYGPYQLICGGDKFAYVDTGDSIESFSFVKYHLA
jgi:hypothetical protein